MTKPQIVPIAILHCLCVQMHTVKSHILDKTSSERSNLQAGVLVSEIHPAVNSQNSILLEWDSYLCQQLGLRVETPEFHHEFGRVVIARAERTICLNVGHERKQIAQPPISGILCQPLHRILVHCLGRPVNADPGSIPFELTASSWYLGGNPSPECESSQKHDYQGNRR